MNHSNNTSPARSNVNDNLRMPTADRVGQVNAPTHSKVFTVPAAIIVVSGAHARVSRPR